MSQLVESAGISQVTDITEDMALEFRAQMLRVRAANSVKTQLR